MNHYRLFSMAEDLTPYVPCQRRSNIRPERTFYVPLAKQFQISAHNGEPTQNDEENFFMGGLFTPLGSSSHFDCKLESFAESDHFQSPLDKHEMMTEQCFSEIIRSGLNLPALTNRENSSYISDPLHLYECSNFDNNNANSLYSDSGFYDCGKEISSENSNILTAIGEKCKNEHLVDNIPKPTIGTFDSFKSVQDLHPKIPLPNYSSPVLTNDSPVTDCGHITSGSNPNVSRTNHPILDCANCQPDAEDLEVAMINESFEEQQKQTKLFENALKTFFFSNRRKKVGENAGLCTNIDNVGSIGGTDGAAEVGNTSVSSEGSVVSGIRERMPYTATIAANSMKQNAFKQLGDGTSSTVSAGISVLGGTRTKNVEILDLSHRDISDIGSRNYDNMFQQNNLSGPDCTGPLYDVTGDQKLPDFDVEEMILDDAALRRAAQTLSSGRYNIGETLREVPLTESRRDFVKAKKDRSSSGAISNSDQKQVQAPMGSADEKLDATAAIAYNVVESLFVGGNSLDHPTPLPISAAKETYAIDVNKESNTCGKEGGADEEALAPAVQNVFDAYRLSKKQSDLLLSYRECVSPDVDFIKAIKEAKSEACSMKKADDSAGIAAASCDSAVDSWEELDCDDSKLVDEIQSAMGKVKIRKPKIDYFIPSGPFSGGWDEKELPNVLEAYDLPPRKNYEDIKHELAKLDCADVTFQKVDDSHCLISFSSASAALKALIAARQRSACPWLRLRSMCDASVAGKEKARLRSTSLQPYKPRPQTTMVVARRLVENALGKRANVSAEQRRAERKRLNEAKVQKEAKAAIWEDIS